jgi:hypothetical protein
MGLRELASIGLETDQNLASVNSAEGLHKVESGHYPRTTDASQALLDTRVKYPGPITMSVALCSIQQGCPAARA